MARLGSPEGLRGLTVPWLFPLMQFESKLTEKMFHEESCSKESLMVRLNTEFKTHFDYVTHVAEIFRLNVRQETVSYVLRRRKCWPVADALTPLRQSET